MSDADPSLSGLFDALAAREPPSCRLALRPSAGTFAAQAARFTGGHAARWFAATDGQQDDAVFAEGYSLCSLEEALQDVQIDESLRREVPSHWVEAHWLTMAHDLGGGRLMIDDRDGRVLAVAHDDDHVRELAASPERWLRGLLEGLERGSVVFDPELGLVAASRAEVTIAPSPFAATPKTRRAGAPRAVWWALALALASAALLLWWWATRAA